MDRVKILIADDELPMLKLVSDFLKREGYSVHEARDGRQALELFHKEKRFDLVILDVMMPEIDGWSVCREIRQQCSAPIIMLTAKSEESDELYGFNLGADEYITKPFSPLILVARVQALLRRAGRDKKSLKEYNGLKIDEVGHVVYLDEKAVDLSPKEFELLVYLTDNDGIALSREQILNTIWNYDYFGDVRTVDTHIKNLRLKLGGKGDYIQTIRGLGYKFEVKNETYNKT
ncbi:DNA-binding response OmpR family regulator [Anaerobacterium chartisolvens]|uniref:Stage 0 sporulation protein A homolog n=1 Tax=Anaerobacterium chartisolvens TaxID=1297424 RepID=A0A369B7K1_9FIRM|nr:response regulator transcription factor [Anaerobacterium chartisolvens]RCX16526.1 DNA-binding response OmpR family regulator [Anaerobacterium chartisolvens]